MAFDKKMHLAASSSHKMDNPSRETSCEDSIRSHLGGSLAFGHVPIEGAGF